MARTLIAAVLLFAGAATASTGTQKPELSAGAKRGLVLVEQHCSACHAVAENRTSPNPEAPPFQDIANRPGVTGATLQQFLRDSHNYPAAMNFEINEGQIGDLADYIASMKEADYRPVM